MDKVAKQVVQLGRETRMAKMDIKSAYQLVPVHPQDRLLLGMSPKIFITIADALKWVIEQRKLLGFTLGELGQDTCRHNLEMIPQHMCGVEGYSGLELMCGPECLPNISGH